MPQQQNIENDEPGRSDKDERNIQSIFLYIT